MRLTAALVALMLCAAGIVTARAQVTSPPGASPPGAPPESSDPAMMMGGMEATPAVRFTIALSPASGDDAALGTNEVVALLAYLAADPELLKGPDLAADWIKVFGGDGVGSTMHVARDVMASVGNPRRGEGGVIEFYLAAYRASDREHLAAAAQRVADALRDVPTLSQEQRTNRLREIKEKLAALKDKKELLQSVTLSTANLGQEILKERIKAAELERQRLEMELVAQRVRSDAIAREVERIQKDAEERLGRDTVLKQLNDVVAMREEEAKRTEQLVQTGDVSMAEAAAVRERVMQARIRATEREEALRQGTKADLLERLNAELASAMINRAEMEVRLAMLRDRQPSIDIKQMTEEKLDQLTEQYRALFRDPGALPPLYFQLEKQAMELRREKVALLVKNVKVTEVPAPTTKAR